MKPNLKSFLLGSMIGLMPVILYGFIKLKPQEKENVHEFKYKNVSFIASYKLETKRDTPTPTIKDAFPTIKPTDTPTPIPTNTPLIQTASIEIKTSQAPEEIKLFIEKYAAEYGVNRDMMLIIARCESNFCPEDVNGPFGGIYQFLSSTWISNRNFMGLDPNPDLRFEAEEAVRTAAFKMSRDGYGAWPDCSQKASYILELASNNIN